jgi:hypothetical protein
MEIIKERLTRQDLRNRFTTSFPTLVKAVVDLGRGIMAADAEWHADLQILLLKDGARVTDLWGINLNVFEPADRFIAYESLINVRPAQSHYSIEIQDPGVIEAIRAVVDALVDYGQVPGVREPAAACGRPAGDGFGAATVYPCFKHHRQLTMEKWRSLEPWKRVLMIANEFGRAKTLIPGGWGQTLNDCYERTLELFHITIEAGRMEGISSDIIAGLLRLRERTAELLVAQRADEVKNRSIREALIGLDPEANHRIRTAGANREPA